MLSDILDALGPIFFGIILGYVGGKTGDLDNKHVGQLNALVLDFAIPLAVFATIVQASRATLLGQLPLAGLLLSSMLTLYAATYVIARWGYGFGSPAASIQALTVAIPNIATAGFPLVGALFGPKELVGVAVVIACGNICVSPITLLILEANALGGDKSIMRSFASVLRKPVVLAPIIAVAVVLVGLSIPAFVQKSLSLMGEVSGGAGLFLTGLVVSAQVPRIDTNVSIQAVLANVAHPALVAGLAWLFAVEPLAAREAIVLAALPVGFFGIFFGLRFRQSSDAAGMTLIVSTALSVLTLSAAIYLTAGMGHP